MSFDKIIYLCILKLMTQFVRYQHVERIADREETQGIHNGKCYLFDKIDGCNCSIGLGEDGKLWCASRNRVLSEKKDHQNFYKSMHEKEMYEKLMKHFKKYPNHILYGEWLVKNHFAGYEDGAWRKFYIFDVYQDGQPIPFAEYSYILDESHLRYIPPADIIEPQSLEELLDRCKSLEPKYLCQTGQIGEGLVIKNYQFKNDFGQVQFGKYVREDFIDDSKVQKKVRTGLEKEIANHYFTEVFIRKEYGKWCTHMKLEVDKEIDKKYISAVIKHIFTVFVEEEMSHIILKKYKGIILNTEMLYRIVANKIKIELKEEFGLSDR